MTDALRSLYAILFDLLQTYKQGALWIERHGPASDKLLHMNLGLAIWLATAWLRGRSWGDRRNLIPLAAFEALNEVADYLFPYRWTLSGTIGDVFWTLFWPVVLTLVIGGRGATRRRR